MTNWDQRAAWAYHDATKHSYWSLRTDAHYLDWSNQPRPFKIYEGLEAKALPQGLKPISETPAAAGSEPLPDLEALARILHWTAGITRRRQYPGGEIFFRAAACTGALYEVELYVVCGDMPGLAAGVYHYGPKDHALRQLRTGDHRPVLVHATAGEPAVVRAPIVIICTGTYWRNAWKYQARTYRHFGWDNGTMLANMVAVAGAVKLPARVILGFVDAEVNRLIGVDADREVAFSMVAIGMSEKITQPVPQVVEPISLATLPLSEREVDYPLMRDMHEGSSLASVEEVVRWRQGNGADADAGPRVGGISLAVPEQDGLPGGSVEQVILRRGSTRRFAREPIGFAEFSTSMYYATRGIPADFLQPFGSQLNDLYLIVNAVEDIDPGAYFYDRRTHALECLKPGDFRKDARHLGLDQDLPGDSSAAIFLLTDLKTVLDRFGNRGYRAAQLEAGMIGGKLYLAAYAMGFGATGLTFYDDEVVQFFSPHAVGKSTIFLMAIGRKFKPAPRKA